MWENAKESIWENAKESMWENVKDLTSLSCSKGY